MEIVLASHSNLAKGMYDTASLIMGKQNNLHYLTAYLYDEFNFKDQLSKIIEPIFDQQIVFVSDVIGGSVNNELMLFTAKKQNYVLVSGMNLPFVLELINFASNFTGSIEAIQKKLSELIDIGRQGLKIVEYSDNGEEDEF